MKKHKRLAAGIASIAVIALWAAAYFFFPIKPFSRLSADAVQQILVYAVPPGVQVELADDALNEAVQLLKDLTVYHPTRKADFTAGQTVRFTVLYTDGTSVEIAVPADASLALSGRTYRANDKSVEALNAFANRVVK